jgi:hypothetical protein
MKNSTLTIEFEQAKLDALRYFAEQREVTLQAELDAFLTKLYEKYVPEPTRKFIESRPPEPPRPKRSSNPPRSLDEHNAV